MQLVQSVHCLLACVGMHVLVECAEYWLFFAWRSPAYVCLDVFVYHNKGTTLKEVAPGHRGVNAKDIGFV